jgi:hypothetical protein
MTTFEQEQPLLGDPAARDSHVFAAATELRARALRLAGFFVAIVSLAWIAALAVALLGAGALPDALPAAKARPTPRPDVLRTPDSASSRGTPGAAPRRVGPASGREVGTATAVVVQAGRTSRASATVAAPRAPTTPAVPLPPPPPPPPAAQRQGWAKRGWTAPPGRVKPDRAPAHETGGTSGVADDLSGTAPGQSGSHAHNG